MSNREQGRLNLESSSDQQLCLDLMKADKEEDVIQLLKKAGYWDDDSCWRCYGDIDKNYSEIGNQASSPEAALVEKVVNAVDARLMRECLVSGIDPEGHEAPQTMREAVARFFEPDMDPHSDLTGRIKNWDDAKRTRIARGITLTATGATGREGNPCFTISDCGEGQTPEQVPNTLLSLPSGTGSNKLRVPFVQGKFNMGGTGALRFCGYNNVQLIVTRRDPAIVKRNPAHEDDYQWSFTIVRRESPKGNVKSSVYKYLAPIGAETNPGCGGVLRFPAETMPIFPEGRQPYAKQAEWGTLIKLYEYKATGCKTNMLLRDGILSRLDLLLPDVALPVRLHEARDYRGHEGSFETTLTGIGVRLDDGKADNLEAGFPLSSPMSAAGEQMTAAIYVFKKGKAVTYRKNEGVIFVVNGQTHGHLTIDFFRRTKLGLSYLSDSLLVVVDCTKFSARAREDLFMNSRDRLSKGDFRAQIEATLEDILKHHDGLRKLSARRREEEIASRLEDSKPLGDVLESLLRNSPTLSTLFLQGKRLQNPFKTKTVDNTLQPFKGQRYPTYFKFKGKDYGTELVRDCHINMKFRITFETDAVNEYFSRDIDPGDFNLVIGDPNLGLPVSDYILNLQDGIASLSVQLPSETMVGDELRFTAIVNDSTRVEPFQNRFIVKVKEAVEPGNGHGNRQKPPSNKEGDSREAPTGISLPNIHLVNEQEWQNHTPVFDKYTALRIKNAGNVEEDGNNGKPIYDFFVNKDNVYLKNELKLGQQSEQVTEARFIHGLVLLGIALVQQEIEQQKVKPNDSIADEGQQVNIEDRVADFTKAVAPVLIPMIDALGSLSLGNEPIGGGVGKAT